MTSPTTYSLAVTGPFTYNGTGTFSVANPIDGFEVEQSNSAGGTPDHNAYFNNPEISAAPEPSGVSVLLIVAAVLGGSLILRRRMATPS